MMSVVFRVVRFALMGAVTLIAHVVHAQDRVLEPGDTLSIQCKEDPRLNLQRTISSLGTLSIPRIGEVPAVLMGRRKLEARLVALVADTLGEDVHLTVDEAPNVTTPVRIEGLVRQPIVRTWRNELRIRDLMRQVQVQDGADPRFVTLSEANGAEFVVDTDTNNIRLRPGDRVMVGPSRSAPTVIVLGPVAHPGIVPATEGLTLSAAIAAVGGLTGHGDPHHISVQRSTGSVEQVDLRTGNSILLFRGDTVGVGEVEKLLFVTVEGAVLHPGLIEFHPGMTLTEALKAAGPRSAKLDHVMIRRILDKAMKTSTFELGPIRAHLKPDPALMPSDLIILGAS